MLEDSPLSTRRCVIEANRLANQAFLKGRFEKAALIYQRAAAALSPAEDDLACELYENLGLTYLNMRQYRPAIRCFWRALDGSHERPQSLAYLVTCLVNDHKPVTARKVLQKHLDQFGAHPQGFTPAQLDELVSQHREHIAFSWAC